MDGYTNLCSNTYNTLSPTLYDSRISTDFAQTHTIPRPPTLSDSIMPTDH